MPDPTDTADAPAETPTPGTPERAPAGTPAVDVATMLEENRKLTEERDKLAAQYRETRKWATQSSQSAAELRRQREARDTTFDDATTASRGGDYSTVVSDLAEVKFKLNNPDWNKVVDKQTGHTVWDKMNEILFNDAKAEEHIGRTPYHTLRNIYREVQYQRLLATQKEAGRPMPTSERHRLAAQAEMSGQGANIPTPAIDLSDPNMTADQLIEAADKAGLLDDLVDPNDPPSWMRR